MVLKQRGEERNVVTSEVTGFGAEAKGKRKYLIPSEVVRVQVC